MWHKCSRYGRARPQAVHLVLVIRMDVSVSWCVAKIDGVEAGLRHHDRDGDAPFFGRADLDEVPRDIINLDVRGRRGSGEFRLRGTPNIKEPGITDIIPDQKQLGNIGGIGCAEGVGCTVVIRVLKFRNGNGP